jgi:adenosylmethionine-8-amino-7-oxononanoate aminotransferase
MINPDDYPLWNSPVVGSYLQTLQSENMIVEGRGIRVRDAGGRWLLDARSGLWNVSLGYDHPKVVEAVKRQVDTLPYANLIGYGRPGALAVEAAEALLPHLPVHMNKIRYFSNGGQAVEGAMLLSRFLHRVSGQEDRLAVFGVWSGYHGLGAGAGALTGIPYVHDQSGPLVPYVRHAEGGFGPGGSDLVRVVREYGPQRVAAVVVEPVVGEGGHVLSDDYLHGLQHFCAEHGIHLIVDEVTTGMGRTGDFTRTQQVGIHPDMITLGKGLSCGYAPLSAVVLSDEIYERLLKLDYDRKLLIGATNDGHPLGLAASIAVVESLTTEGVLENVQHQGTLLRKGLLTVAERFPQVKAVRGTGLMQAVEVADTAAAEHLRLAMEARGVLVSTLAVCPAIMIIPPLVISDDGVTEILAALESALAEQGA